MSKDEYFVEHYEQSWWVVAAESAWLNACHATGNRLGGHGLGEWAWKLPIGCAKWDFTNPEESWLENSLAGKLMDFENAVVRFAHNRQTNRVRVILTQSQFLQICDDGWEWLAEEE